MVPCVISLIHAAYAQHFTHVYVIKEVLDLIFQINYTTVKHVVFKPGCTIILLRYKNFKGDRQLDTHS